MLRVLASNVLGITFATADNFSMHMNRVKGKSFYWTRGMSHGV